MKIEASITPLATVPGDAFSREDLQVLHDDYQIRLGDAEAERTLTIE